jgi:hypothetical protein
VQGFFFSGEKLQCTLAALLLQIFLTVTCKDEITVYL